MHKLQYTALCYYLRNMQPICRGLSITLGRSHIFVLARELGFLSASCKPRPAGTAACAAVFACLFRLERLGNLACRKTRHQISTCTLCRKTRLPSPQRCPSCLCSPWRAWTVQAAVVRKLGGLPPQHRPCRRLLFRRRFRPCRRRPRSRALAPATSLVRCWSPAPTCLRPLTQFHSGPGQRQRHSGPGQRRRHRRLSSAAEPVSGADSYIISGRPGHVHVAPEWQGPEPRRGPSSDRALRRQPRRRQQPAPGREPRTPVAGAADGESPSPLQPAPPTGHGSGRPAAAAVQPESAAASRCFLSAKLGSDLHNIPSQNTVRRRVGRLSEARNRSVVLRAPFVCSSDCKGSCRDR